ncbi:unnamed protein product [Brassicogethes aeneus]|uniref:Uncharacterized protein n=1 Tax=Brassicogethes aeneus TaxID=1431903 RepID=A0A9P0B9I5_BRAAE|nr:unnamed protein product [Brassicogethes aeneus]
MLLRVLLITVLIYLCQCRPLDSDADAKIVKYENDVRPDGYKFEYQDSNGLTRQESGGFKTVNNEKIWVVSGAYSYIDPLGHLQHVEYIADEKGYRMKKFSKGTVKPIPEFHSFISSAAIASLNGGGLGK